MILRAVGGLCNRLRAILSYRAVHGSIDVIWPINEMVHHTAWHAVFHSLPGVHFVPEGVFDVEAYDIHRSAPSDWTDGYRDVKPHTAVADDVDGAMSFLAQPYLAVHVRRTDQVPNAATLGVTLEPLDTYREWRAQWPEMPVYVATDNGETQRAVVDTIGGRAVGRPIGGGEAQGLLDHRRNGTLADAAVDLFVCGHSEHFRGTSLSSFSDTIEILRRLNGKGA